MRPPIAPAPGWTETGIASWYGAPYHGRKAANGETYDMEQLTAAHRTLPFGAIVRVQRSDNHKAVVVRINDRGPFVDGRIIDLSKAAARAIDLIGPGISRVQLELLSYSTARPQLEDGRYAVQAGSFSDRRNADRLRQRLLRHYDPVEIAPLGDTFRVIVGNRSTQADAEALASSLRQQHLEVFVIRME